MGKGCGRGFACERQNFRSVLSRELEMERLLVYGRTFGLMERLWELDFYGFLQLYDTLERLSLKLGTQEVACRGRAESQRLGNGRI